MHSFTVVLGRGGRVENTIGKRNTVSLHRRNGLLARQCCSPVHAQAPLGVVPYYLHTVPYRTVACLATVGAANADCHLCSCVHVTAAVLLVGALPAGDLIQMFRGLAMGTPLLFQLVEKFGDQIGKLVSDKLVLEYL